MPLSDAVARWRWYARGFRGRRAGLLGVIAGTSLTAVTILPLLHLIRYALDVAVPQRSVDALVIAGLGMVALRVVAGAATVLLVRIGARLLRAGTADLRVALLGDLQRLGWDELGRREGDALQDLLVQDSERIENMSHALGTALLPAVVPLAVLAAAMAVISPALFALVVVSGAVLKGLTWVLLRQVRRSTARFQTAFSAYHRSAGWAIGLLRPSLLHGRGAWVREGFAQSARALATAGEGMVRSNAAHSAANGVSTGIGAALLLIGGGLMVLGGTLTLGQLATFVFAATLANGYVGAIAGAVPLLAMGDVALERLYAAVPRSEKVDAAGGDPGEGPLTVERVTLAVGGRTLLHEADLVVAPGALVALIAPNGTGKTSLLNAVLGLVAPNGGRVCRGGRDLRDVDGERYRRDIGIVPQQPWFFAGRVADNVLLGRDPAELPRLEAVLGMEGRLDTALADGGLPLSGGERQRLALLRAMLGRPPLMVLDEPTNHLDDAAVAAFLAWLGEGPAAPGVLVATHDPRIIAAATAVYRIAERRLVRER